MHKLFLTLLVLSWSLSLLATEASLPLQHSLDLNSFRGKTFLQAMMDQKNGIKGLNRIYWNPNEYGYQSAFRRRVVE